MDLGTESNANTPLIRRRRRSRAQRVRQVSAFSRPHTLRKLDQRTREAKYLRDTVAELTRHVGGNPSAPQRLLIQRAAILSLRLAQLDNDAALSEHAMRLAACWQNHLRLILREIGIKPAAEADGAKAQPLDDVLADIRGNPNARAGGS
jgi:hypothetical protein